MKHKFLEILFLILCPLLSFSQKDSTITLNLKQAQEYAVKNNLTIKNAQLDIEAAQQKVWETTAIGLPQITGNINYQHIPGDLPTANFGADSSSMQLYSYIFNALETLRSQHGNLDIGTVPELEGSEPFTLGVKNSTTYGVTVSQLVFSGEYIVGLQASKTYLQISKLNHEKQELDLKSGIINSYISILILENNKSIVDSTIENMQLLYNETKALNQQGFLESTDADQIQITLNTLINSKNTIQRQIEISYMLFKIQLGTGLNNKIVLSDDLNSAYGQLIGNTSNSEFDINNNIDYKMLKNQVKVSELSLKRERFSYLPTISAFYNYQDKTNKASFDFTINHIIGVNVDIPIFSSFQRNAKVQQAKIEYEKSLNNKTLTEYNLETQAEQLYFNFENAMEKYKVTIENVELSKKVFDHASVKYKQGMLSSIDLTQANNTYLQAESDKVNALYELIKTKIELEKILNKL